MTTSFAYVFSRKLLRKCMYNAKVLPDLIFEAKSAKDSARFDLSSFLSYRVLCSGKLVSDVCASFLLFPIISVPRSKKQTVAVVSTLKSNKKVLSSEDKWKAAKEELHEEEEKPADTYEIFERKR